MKWEVDVQENSNLKKLQMPDWEVILTKSINFEYTDDFSNVHSGLQFSLIFQRIKSNRILHTYIPSIMLCIVTVFSGLIPADKTSEKVTICVTTFLSMIALFGAAKYDPFTSFWETMKFFKNLTILRDNWPETSYLKSIDYWMVLCYISVFYYILECCVLIYIESKQTPESKGPLGPMAIYIEPKKVGFQ